jgi:glycosyltransferase involved in cell wall biosynthesis
MAEGRGTYDGLDVVSLVESRLDGPGPEVTYQHVNGDGASLRKAADVLNTHDVALIQHEYGIFGGPDGVEVLDLVANLEVPSIVTLHTVLSNPTPAQKTILERLVGLSDETVVMSDTALRRLERRYDLDPMKVRVVPHGAMASLAGPSLADGIRPVVLTWGLIGPGKGLESAIEAFADLKDLRPQPRYIILGKTHPKVQAAQGDAYLNSLKARAHSLGLDDVVEFDGRYLDLESLTTEVRRADFVLLPYESTEQVTSGVLVEAVAAGKPVVATAFPHAIEMLGTGAGTVVPHSDPLAMAGALRTLISDPEHAARMAGVARSIGSTLYWPAVAGKYEAIVSGLTSSPPVAALSETRHSRRPVGHLARVS